MRKVDGADGRMGNDRGLCDWLVMGLSRIWWCGWGGWLMMVERVGADGC